MKIIVTGAKGMLGTDLCEVLRDEQGHDVIGLDREEMDITDVATVLSYISGLEADIIIHPAAYTQVDGCEENISLAYLSNAIGARNLAIAAQDNNIPIVHISTDYVFDGKSDTPYKESDVVNPLSVYGKSKLDGENFVKELSMKHYIVRTQWLYGKNGSNFVRTITKAAREKGHLTVVNDQFGCPTYTKDLARAIAELIQKPDYGTFHLTNSGITSWYGFTQEILSQMGLSHVELTPCTTAEYPRPATRPAYAPLDNFYYRLCGHAPLRAYTQALSDYLKEENWS